MSTSGLWQHVQPNATMTPVSQSDLNSYLIQYSDNLNNGFLDYTDDLRGLVYKVENKLGIAEANIFFALYCEFPDTVSIYASAKLIDTTLQHQPKYGRLDLKVNADGIITEDNVVLILDWKFNAAGALPSTDYPLPVWPA